MNQKDGWMALEEGQIIKKVRRVTSADVARAAGVSRATVSYVLNDVPDRNISEATRELVRATAKRLGHLPYAPARALRSGRSNIVLALVPGFAIGYVFDRVLDRLNDALAARGFALLVHHHVEQVRSISDLWGLVTPTLLVTMGGLNPAERAAIEDSQVRLVDGRGIVSVTLIGRMQAEYLLSRGHRRLGFGMPADPHLEAFALARLRGIQQVCREAEVPQPEVTVINFDQASIQSAITSWRSGPDPVTAVCAHNDDMALVLMAGLSSLGLRAGRDLAVMGADDIPMASIGVTTVAIDVDALGAVMVELVINSLEDKPGPSREGDFLRLVIRDSA